MCKVTQAGWEPRFAWLRAQALSLCAQKLCRSTYQPDQVLFGLVEIGSAHRPAEDTR